MLLAPWWAAAASLTPSQAVDAFHEAVRNNQPDRVMAMLAPEALIYEQGFSELSRHQWMRDQFGPAVAFAADTERKVLRRESRDLGDIALVMTSTATTVRLPDQPLVLKGAETAVLRREGEQWLIMHLHWSAHEDSAAER